MSTWWMVLSTLVGLVLVSSLLSRFFRVALIDPIKDSRKGDTIGCIVAYILLATWLALEASLIYLTTYFIATLTGVTGS